MRTLVYRKSRRERGREPERHKLHVAKGDTVRVIRGEHRGKEGKVLRVHPKQFRIVVEGVNVVKKHKRATGAPGSERGIIEFPAPIAASNVMLLDPKSGEPTRVRRRRDQDGTIERIAVKSGQPIPRVKRRWQRPKRSPRRETRRPGSHPRVRPSSPLPAPPRSRPSRRRGRGCSTITSSACGRACSSSSGSATRTRSPSSSRSCSTSAWGTR